MEDALLSPESFSVLSGAGLIDAEDTPIYVHTTTQVAATAKNTIVLDEVACWSGYGEDDEQYHSAADIFCMALNDNGETIAEPCVPKAVEYADGKTTITCQAKDGTDLVAGNVVLVDYYVKRTGGAQQIEITADKFAGNYYIEASTLFRRESDGVDMPAEFVIPNGKVQSNFTFTMASTGDPSTFTFTVDAFPAYTKFDKTKKVMAIIQIVSEDEEGSADEKRAACEATTDETLGG